jgi:hypothetical protein
VVPTVVPVENLPVTKAVVPTVVPEGADTRNQIVCAINEVVTVDDRAPSIGDRSRRDSDNGRIGGSCWIFVPQIILALQVEIFSIPEDRGLPLG